MTALRPRSPILSHKGERMTKYVVRRQSGNGHDYLCGDRPGSIRLFGSKSAVIRYLHLRGLDKEINSRNIHELTTIQIQEYEQNGKAER